jgi:hypothetical protein
MSGMNCKRALERAAAFFRYKQAYIPHRDRSNWRLSKVLDDHCARCGIERSWPDYEAASYLAMSLFGALNVGELVRLLRPLWPAMSGAGLVPFGKLPCH